MVHERVKRYFRRIASVRSSPHEIALGFSLGALIAILPTPGISVLIGALVVLAYPKISKLALFGALALFNPIVLIPFQLLSLKIGGLFFTGEPVVELQLTFFEAVYHYSRRYIVGNIIVSVVVSSICYPLVYFISKSVQKKRAPAET